jgi:hypothetical protein
MINIFAEDSTQRLVYTCDFVAACANVGVQVFSDEGAFAKAKGYAINYSERVISSDLSIIPAALLFETGIRNQEIQHGSFGGELCLTFDGKTDPLASIFFVLSRYEEYLPFAPDVHGRFSASGSLSKKMGFLHKLFCDRLVFQILNGLGMAYPKNDSVKLIPTFDIDNAYAYKHKPKWRLFMAHIKDLISGKKEQCKQRSRVLQALEKDPFDTYRIIEEIANQADEVHVFWLLGNYARYDKNIPWKNKALQELIRKVSRFSKAGIHPSYASSSKQMRIQEEKVRLEGVLNQPIQSSRQHFLRLRLPETYRNLLWAGIRHDYTMGFADDVGFRCGTARPHYWFDLEKNETTALVLHPFAYMDGTLLEYLTLTPEEACRTIEALYREVEQFGGHFVCIWHNETIGENGKWKDWRRVLDFTITLNETNYE